MSRNLIADNNSGSTNRFPWSLPFLPVSSSDQERWEGFSVRHYRSPAFEVPEHPLSVHRVQIQLGRPAKLEATQDGRLLRGRFLNGDLIYTPPKVIYGAQWKEEREILVILLEPLYSGREPLEALSLRIASTLSRSSDFAIRLSKESGALCALSLS